MDGRIEGAVAQVAHREGEGSRGVANGVSVECRIDIRVLRISGGEVSLAFVLLAPAIGAWSAAGAAGGDPLARRLASSAR